MDADDQDEWISWPRAAEIVGCRVPTIDYNQRLGRIESRPYNGSHPTLRRSSVEAFAVWYAAKQERVVEHRATKRIRAQKVSAAAPENTGWLTAKETGARLGVASGHVGWLIRHGHLNAEKCGGKYWVRETDVIEYAEAVSVWVSAVAAARIVGCGVNAILAAVDCGDITQRETTNNALPSLNRASVHDFAPVWHERQRVRAEKAVNRPRPPSSPPDDHHEWVTAAGVAELMGTTTGYVTQLALANRLPHTMNGSRRWFRRVDAEVAATARRFRLEQAEARRRAHGDNDRT